MIGLFLSALLHISRLQIVSMYLYNEPCDNRIIKSFVAALNPELKWRLGSTGFLCSSQTAAYSPWKNSLLSLLFRVRRMLCRGSQPTSCHPFKQAKSHCCTGELLWSRIYPVVVLYLKGQRRIAGHKLVCKVAFPYCVIFFEGSVTSCSQSGDFLIFSHEPWLKQLNFTLIDHNISMSRCMLKYEHSHNVMQNYSNKKRLINNA